LPSRANKYRLLHKYRRAVLDGRWQDHTPMSREAQQVANFTPHNRSTIAIKALALFFISATTATAHASNNDVVLYASRAPVKAGTWTVVADSTAAGGYAMANPDSDASMVTAPLAQPVNYFQLTFPAYSGMAYHLWIRGKAAKNSTSNDSVFVQFSD